MNYQDERNQENMIKMKKVIAPLPYYVSDYFTARRTNTTTRTRLSYAYDIRKFFMWLNMSIPELKNQPLKSISLSHLKNLTARDIEEYIDFLQTDTENLNHLSGVARKLSALSAFFDYLYKADLIENNPCDKVIKPKQIDDKRIIKMSPDEVAKFLDCIEYGHESFSKKQMNYLIKTRERDLAIATLLLGTGIRVSECVGLNISDVDINNCRITVFRKGGKIQHIPIGDKVIDVLEPYMLNRNKIQTNDDALFLSMQKTRMTTQAVENMVNKYAQAIGTTYRITPHKLRKTYGTELYKETGDIYLVASALGHSSVDTTKKHYAAQDEERLLQARNAVKLRE